MNKFSTSIFLLLLFSSTLFGRFVPGSLQVSYIPKESGGTSGTWEVVVFCPYGETFSTGQVDISSTDTRASSVMPIEGFIAIGTYIIELKSNIVDPTDSFLSSITIAFESDDSNLTWDPITFKNFPVLQNGENSQLTYTIAIP